MSGAREARSTARPPLGRALRADAVAFAANRGERFAFSSRRAEWWHVVKMTLRCSDYAAMALYRLRAALAGSGVPVMPWALARAEAWLFRLRIGPEVVIDAGVYVPHGAITIEGETVIGSGCVLTPWVWVGPARGDRRGPDVGAGVFIGTQAVVRGAVKVGQGARIGANCVVEEDVAPYTMVGGVPARVMAEGLPGRLALEQRRREGERAREAGGA